MISVFPVHRVLIVHAWIPVPDNDFDVWSRPICTHVNPDNFVIRVFNGMDDNRGDKFVVEKSITAPFLSIHIYQCLSDLSYNDI